MQFLRKYFDNTKHNSLVNKLRRKRFKTFLEFISDFKKPVKILDLGGTFNYWKQMGMTDSKELNITLLNTEPQDVNSNIKFIQQDARDLSSFKDKEFDLVFSNSLIEHITPFEKQKKLAEEISRISNSYFIQTPNYYFPFEPHFLIPMFQFFPLWLKIRLVKHFNLGWFQKTESSEKASEIINSIRLIKFKEFSVFFPEAKITREKFFFFTKSFIALKKSD